LATEFGTVIARRELARANSRSPIVVEIGIPQRRAEAEWACPYRIRGLAGHGIRYAFGIDPVQALQLVQQAIWHDLKPYERELSWLGERGWTGFYRFYGVNLGQAHMRRVERAIDREVAEETRRLKKRVAKRRAAGKGRHRYSSAAV
jgi:hypothetical protein